MEVKKRKSNFELMRIVSMLMIILWHVTRACINLKFGSPKVFFTDKFIRAFCIVHVDSFVLLTGYFQCKSKFKFSKIISLNNSAWFYKSIEFIIFVLLGCVIPNAPMILKEFFPLDLESYWFIQIYLLLYILTPFINIFINSINQNQYKKILIVLFFIFSIIPSLTKGEAIFKTNASGFSIVNFIFLYLLGAYLRIYPIDKTNFGKKYTCQMKKIIFLFLYVFIGLINFSLNIVAFEMLKGGDTASYIGSILDSAFISYDNPLVIIQTVCYFMFFSYMNFHSKIINYISSTTFGIYLIHEYHFFRQYGYDLIFHTSKIIPIGYSSVVKCFIIAIIIFIGGVIIESLRKLLFKFIYNRKLSCKFRKWYRSYFEKLGLNISW